CSSYASSNVLF
nr:immunoglobulin light chain junction region [Macaca mulatta]